MRIDELLATRARLERALASASQTIEFEDRRIERRSIDDILQQLAWVNGEIDKENGVAPADTTAFKRVRYTVSDKDL